MKTSMPAALAGLLLWTSGAALAQQGPNHDLRFDLVYSPMRVSTSSPSGVVNANMGTLTFTGEGRVFEGLLFGGSYTRGQGNELTITGVTSPGVTLSNVAFSDPQYQDIKVYAKIPLNWQAFAKAERTMTPRPRFSPVYAYLGFKSTTLNAQAPSTAPTLGRLNIEQASGGGLGLGADLDFDAFSLYGQVVYYPSLSTSKIGASTTSDDGFLRVLEYDLGFKARLGKSPVHAQLGYHREQHQASNVTLNYDGIRLGASAQF